VKQPDRCPHCGSVKLVRKGTRAKKLEAAVLAHTKWKHAIYLGAYVNEGGRTSQREHIPVTFLDIEQVVRAT
jgi:hypothetical protein